VDLKHPSILSPLPSVTYWLCSFYPEQNDRSDCRGSTMNAEQKVLVLTNSQTDPASDGESRLS
jgi:hypothetical protein